MGNKDSTTEKKKTDIQKSIHCPCFSEACNYIPTTRSKCTFSEDESLALHLLTLSSQHCEVECEAEIKADSSRCWWYNYNPGSQTCTLSFSKAPPKCKKNAANTASGDVRRSCISRKCHVYRDVRSVSNIDLHIICIGPCFKHGHA